MDSLFFDSWTSTSRTIVVGVAAYLAIVIILRLTGKRTLSEWNAFDFIVTVALGSILATVILSEDVALLDGVLAFAVLILCQFAITWLSVRSAAVRRMIKNRPALLLLNGEFLHDAMRSQRVTESEILAALRSQGIGSVREVDAVVLEAAGHFSVIQTLEHGDSTLSDVSGYGAPRES